MSNKLSRKDFLKSATAFGTLLFVSNDLFAAGEGASLNASNAPLLNSSGKTRRGSWVQTGKVEQHDIDLSQCEIVIAQNEHSAVQQAGKFLAADIEKISGYLPPIVTSATKGKTSIRLVTVGNAPLPKSVDSKKLKNAYEAYQIITENKNVWLAGADFRGTAFAAYTLSEYLGIDPLYLWTNYEPVQHHPLVLKKTSFFANSPTMKYRGFFHDDEDILPRPYDDRGFPLIVGDVPLEWYKKYFETALRLRMNMAAPYTRVRRRYEVQKCASDWGLYYTSHHYDILLSNPFGFTRFNLAKERGVSPQWDWFKNKENMIKFWKGGVEENREVDAIWPVGLRGTDDVSYKFPEGTSEKAQTAIFNEAIKTQVDTVKQLLPSDKKPLFHFTLYTEMLDKYEKNKNDFNLPEEVMIIWPDDNDGIMRSLPKDLGKWKHGVYYHLAYLGPQRITKQLTHIVSPQRIAEQFRNIVKSGATEFVLVNVSEMREYIMEARMIAELAWDESSVLGVSDPAKEFINWWANEYFGPEAAAPAAEAYQKYYELIYTSACLWQGSDVVKDLVDRLFDKYAGKEYKPLEPDTVNALIKRNNDYQSYASLLSRASQKMNKRQRQYFYENVELGILMDWRPTQAALKLLDALKEPDRQKSLEHVASAIEPLEQFEVEILRAERPPFEKWYRETWVRRELSPNNLHRSYNIIRSLYYSGGKAKLFVK